MPGSASDGPAVLHGAIDAWDRLRKELPELPEWGALSPMERALMTRMWVQGAQDMLDRFLKDAKK